jgi:hypothetical protein
MAGSDHSDRDDFLPRWARARLNAVVDRISAFEQAGGITAVLERQIERLKREQERLRHEAEQAARHGPLGHMATVRQAYARLEVPYGSDLATVRTSYRSLMRRYHPDRHAADPERERIATEISQRLTVAYDLLAKHLGR